MIYSASLSATAVFPNATAFGLPAQQVTILDSQNPLFLRQVVMGTEGLRIIRGGNVVQFPIQELLKIAYTIQPNAFTWTPVVTLQPTSSTITHPTACSFKVDATAETGITYKWYSAPSQSVSFTAITPSGVFTNVTTPTLTITDSTGLDNTSYLCQCSGSAGTTNSTYATLTVL